MLFVALWLTRDGMNIDEQVATLMQGTEYGDEQLRRAMEAELRERLLDAEKT